MSPKMFHVEHFPLPSPADGSRGSIPERSSVGGQGNEKAKCSTWNISTPIRLIIRERLAAYPFRSLSPAFDN